MVARIVQFVSDSLSNSSNGKQWALLSARVFCIAVVALWGAVCHFSILVAFLIVIRHPAIAVILPLKYSECSVFVLQLKSVLDHDILAAIVLQLIVSS